MAREPQIFGVGIFGRSRAITAQELVNLYLDIQREDDRAGDSADGEKRVIFGHPEKQSYKYYGAAPARGAWIVWPYLYVVYTNTLYRVDLTGARTVLGTLLTSAGPVYMTDNANQLLVVDNPNGYVYQIFGASAATGQTPAMGLVKIASAGFLGAATCDYLNNFGITSVPGTTPLAAQAFQICNVGDFTGWSGIQFNLKSLASDPLVRVVAFKAGGWLALMGTLTTELWADVGSSPFPFAYLQGAALPYGLAAVGSAVVFGEQGIACLAQSQGGQVKPAILTAQGFDVSDRIAPPDFVAMINNKSKFPTLLDAVGTQYEVDGHRFYRVSFPAAKKTWEWDSRTMAWGERVAFADPGQGGPYIADRGLYAVQFGTDTLMFDQFDGNVYRLGQTGSDTNRYVDQRVIGGVTTDFPILHRLRSRHLFQGEKTLIANELQFAFQQGVGQQIPPGDKPTVQLRISRNKGQTFGNPISAPMGPIGDYGKRTRFLRLGISRDYVVELAHVDPTPFILTSEKVILRGGSS